MIFSIKIDKVTVNEISINKVKIPKNDLKKELNLSWFKNVSNVVINFPIQITGWPIFLKKILGQPNIMSKQSDRKIITAIFIIKEIKLIYLMIL